MPATQPAEYAVYARTARLDSELKTSTLALAKDVRILLDSLVVGVTQRPTFLCDQRHSGIENRSN